MINSRENSEEKMFHHKQRSSFINQNEEILISSSSHKDKVKSKPVEGDYKSSAILNKSSTTTKRKLKVINYVKRKAQSQYKGVFSLRTRANFKYYISLFNLKLSLKSKRQFVRFLFLQQTQLWLTKILEFLSDEILLSIHKTVSYTNYKLKFSFK